MTNVLIFLNDPPHGAELTTMQAFAKHTMNADRVLDIASKRYLKDDVYLHIEGVKKG